jgi:hypothetical protein
VKRSSSGEARPTRRSQSIPAPSASEVGDGGAAPEVPYEVDPAARAVDEDEAGAGPGRLAGEGGHGPVGEVAAAVRVEATEHRQGAVEGDRDRLSPVAVGEFLETHVCRNIGRSVGSLQRTSRPERGRGKAPVDKVVIAAPAAALALVGTGVAVVVAGGDAAAVGAAVTGLRAAGAEAAGWVGDPSDEEVREMAAELFPGAEVIIGPG